MCVRLLDNDSESHVGFGFSFKNHATVTEAA